MGAEVLEVVQRIRLGRMTALRKPTGGARGIVVGDTPRRAVSRAVAQHIAESMERPTAPFQYVLSILSGSECVRHAIHLVSRRGGGGRGEKGQGRIAKFWSRVLIDVVSALAQTAANSQISSKSCSSNERRPHLLQLKHIFLCQFTTSFHTLFYATFNVVTQ